MEARTCDEGRLVVPRAPIGAHPLDQAIAVSTGAPRIAVVRAASS